MKISKKSRNTYLILSFFSFGFSLRIQSMQDQPFSVDRLYPENWYTKAREHCLLVWGTLEDMVERKKSNMLPHYLVDASIGQLVFAKNCLHNIAQNNFTIAHDDIIHLSRIIGTIEERCTRLPHHIQADKADLLKSMVEKLKKKIELLISMTLKVIPNR
jgi:hypothetical protein